MSFRSDVSMDIRLCTAIIIEKNGQFLAGFDVVNRVWKWRDSPFDAWKTRRKNKALAICNKVDGKQFLFNSVVGQLREMR